MLIDSNIIIYAAKPDHAALRKFIEENAPAVSAVSYVEVLGYYRLTNDERRHFETFFAVAKILAISDEVVERAVKLRQTKKLSLGDSLIAGTALMHNLTLVTRNTSDFDWIQNLRLLNPFAANPTSP